MRSLALIRHARAAADPSDDHARPLDPQGESEAGALAEWLAGRGKPLDLLLASSATRARQTAERLSAAWTPSVTIAPDDELYLASAARVLSRLQEVDDVASAVGVVCHSPGVVDLVRTLTVSGDRDALRDLGNGMGTAGCAVLSLELDRWRDLAPAVAHLEAFARPRVEAKG